MSDGAKVIIFLLTALLCGYVNSVPIQNYVDDFENDANRIDNDSIDPAVIFETLLQVESSPENVRTHRASLMKSLMDTTVDPCEDFYQYACGNWEKFFPIPEDKSENNVYALLNNNILVTLKELLTSQATVEDVDALEKARIYYSSCMNQETRNMRGASPLLDLLNEYGGWPVLSSNWTDGNFVWIDLIAEISHLDLGIFIATSIDADFKDSSSTAIHIMEADWGLESKEDYVPGGESLKAYKTLIEEVFSFLNVSEGVAKQTAEEIVDFETKLANITPKSITRANFADIFISMTLKELLNLYPKIEWERYLTIVYGKSIDLNQTIVVGTTPFFDTISDILSETDNRIIVNYIGWRIAYEFMEFLDNNFAEAQHRLDQALTGKQTAESNWKKCVRETNSKMGMAVGAMFVRAHFDQESKKDIEALSEEIKEAFLESLIDMDWLDPTTKQIAEIKANYTGIAVGYPDDILVSSKLNHLYDNVHLKPDTHFENVINVVKNERKRINKQLSKKYNKNFWAMSPAIVNAYFEQTQNRIVVPAAALQPPLYNRYYPKFLNYGGMGYFIGHELTHGFDDVGREFNCDGNMVEWWSEESIKAFEERTSCFTEQYNNYSMHGKPLEGFLSRGENIADNGGIRQAYRAYQKWLIANANTSEMHKEHLEGFNLSQTKMFFLQFAQSWCGSIRPEAIANILNTDLHCPGKYRVIGSLSNFKEFSEEFECPVGTGMNPTSKCRLW